MNNYFFARFIQRLFNQLGTNEIYDRAVAENDYYGKYSTAFKDDEDDKTNVDALAMKRR